MIGRKQENPAGKIFRRSWPCPRKSATSGQVFAAPEQANRALPIELESLLAGAKIVGLPAQGEPSAQVVQEEDEAQHGVEELLEQFWEELKQEHGDKICAHLSRDSCSPVDRQDTC